MTANAGQSRVDGAGGANGHLAPKSSIDRIEQLGIVGAGGGGFPTAAKLKTRVSLVIANAAECEPLLHKDKELLLHYGAEMLAGLRTAMDCVRFVGGSIGGFDTRSTWHNALCRFDLPIFICNGLNRHFSGPTK